MARAMVLDVSLALSCFNQSLAQPANASTRLIIGYGESHMPVSTKSPEAQAFFDQGLALLHSFWFYEADRSFQRAADLDPSCAMAQWGIAMAAGDSHRRNEAIARARMLSTLAPERERLYIRAVEARFEGGRSPTRGTGLFGESDAYQAAMRKIVAFYPDDLNAQAFLALTLISGYEPDGTPRDGTLDAIAILQTIVGKDPLNLGAHHYLVHAIESGGRPGDALSSAERYASLAPRVGHAVHMMGHIYMHVDRWEAAASAFRQAAAADRTYIRENNERPEHAGGPFAHNLHLLAVVYDYQGRYRDSIRVSQELLDISREADKDKSSTALEAHLARLRTLVRFEKWDELMKYDLSPGGSQFAVLTAWRRYGIGLALVGRGDLARARRQLDVLRREIAHLRETFPRVTNAPQVDRQSLLIKALSVAPLELLARIQAREGNAEAALATLQEGIDEEARLGYFEPPLYPQPMQELAGLMCIQMCRWHEAEAFLRAALARDPGSGRALFGLMQVQEARGGTMEAAETRGQFVREWAMADDDVRLNLAKRCSPKPPTRSTKCVGPRAADATLVTATSPEPVGCQRGTCAARLARSESPAAGRQ